METDKAEPLDNCEIQCATCCACLLLVVTQLVNKGANVYVLSDAYVVLQYIKHEK